MECCDAIMEFDEGNFVMCELEKDHASSHQALMFRWEGQGTTKSDFTTWARGLNILKMRCSFQELNEGKSK